jgi:inositol-phosphate transport system ATP-binding protein
VTNVEPMGREILFIVDTTLGTLRVLETGASTRYRVDDRVTLGFQSEQSLVFAGKGGRLLAGTHVALP